MLASENEQEYQVNEDLRLDFLPEELLKKLFSKQDPDDANRGPYEAWWPSHRCNSRYDMVLCPDQDALRERAYVLWDMERLEQYNLLEIFAKLDDQPRPEPDENARAEMERSWDARSKIWQKSGRGLWYADDESKIIWPGQPGHPIWWTT